MAAPSVPPSLVTILQIFNNFRYNYAGFFNRNKVSYVCWLWWQGDGPVSAVGWVASSTEALNIPLVIVSTKELCNIHVNTIIRIRTLVLMKYIDTPLPKHY